MNHTLLSNNCGKLEVNKSPCTLLFSPCYVVLFLVILVASWGLSSISCLALAPFNLCIYYNLNLFCNSKRHKTSLQDASRGDTTLFSGFQLHTLSYTSQKHSIIWGRILSWTFAVFEIDYSLPLCKFWILFLRM